MSSALGVAMTHLWPTTMIAASRYTSAANAAVGFA